MFRAIKRGSVLGSILVVPEVLVSVYDPCFKHLTSATTAADR